MTAWTSRLGNLWTRWRSYARRANPFFQERRYAKTVATLGEVARQLTLAETNAKLAREETARLRADICAIAETASRVRYERGVGRSETYRIVLDISPEQFNYGALSYYGRDVFASHIGQRIAAELRHARFVRPSDAPPFKMPSYGEGQ